MKPRRTPTSDVVYRLEGGNEDNDLWVTRCVQDGSPILLSVWELSNKERERIAKGENVQLAIWGTMHPPVSLDVTDQKLGAR